MFTPGPWQYEATTKTVRSVPANYWLASMDSWDGAVDHDANAKLIAAAPDLLAALENTTSLLSAFAGPDDLVAQTAISESRKAQEKART